MIVSSKGVEEALRRQRRRRLVGVAVLVACLGAVIAVALLLGRRLPSLEAVRATVEPVPEGLRVVTRWYADGALDAVRVSVAPVGVAPTMSTRLAAEAADTVILPAPSTGGTLAGESCVVPLRGGEAGHERCTPWQFVRPSAHATADSGTAARIVVQPGGLQVDPDVDGRCAQWQAANPGRSPWIDVNERAVPACTGPNGKPTVAQFCAFALLPNGEKAITENSRGNPYCEALFAEWSEERVI
ncbi:MAG: hypothetical protein M3Y31_07800 [Gemmatimonadota bacterium]|nr:hypothetical protein [Gemmatimonadota bacterium]